MNTCLSHQNFDKKNKNDISLLMSSSHILIVSDLIRELEKEWYRKLNYDKLLQSLALNIFSLLNYQITVIQQLSEINFDTSIEPILLFNKNIISKKIEQIIYFNENQTENKNNWRTIKNSFYKKDIKQNIKDYSKTAKNFYKKLNSSDTKTYKILSSNNSRKNLKNININQRMIEEEDSSRKHLTSFNNEELKSNNTFNSCSTNLLQKNMGDDFENPVRKVKNIIINAKQKGNSGSLEKHYITNIKNKNKNGINVKIIPGLKNHNMSLSTNNIFYTECNENSKKSNKNIIKQNFEENGNFIIKVETVKDRETKQILQDGMKNIKQKLRLGGRENKVTTSINYYIRNNRKKNRGTKK